MIRWIGVALTLGLCGCTYYYPPGTYTGAGYPAYSGYPTTPGASPYAATPGTPSPYATTPGSDTTSSAGAGNCREFTQRVTIDGKETNAVGHVCQQPDGTWRLM